MHPDWDRRFYHGQKPVFRGQVRNCPEHLSREYEELIRRQLDDETLPIDARIKLCRQLIFNLRETKREANKAEDSKTEQTSTSTNSTARKSRSSHVIPKTKPVIHNIALDDSQWIYQVSYAPIERVNILDDLAWPSPSLAQPDIIRAVIGSETSSEAHPKHAATVCQEARDIAVHIGDSFGIDIHTVSQGELKAIVAEQLAEVTDFYTACQCILGKDARYGFQAQDADVRLFFDILLEQATFSLRCTKVLILQKVVAHARACLTRQ